MSNQQIASQSSQAALGNEALPSDWQGLEAEITARIDAAPTPVASPQASPLASPQASPAPSPTSSPRAAATPNDAFCSVVEDELRNSICAATDRPPSAPPQSTNFNDAQQVMMERIQFLQDAVDNGIKAVLA